MTTRSLQFARRLAPLLPLAAMLVVVAVSSGVAVAQARDGRVVERHGDLVSIFSGDIHVEKNEVLHGSVICVGGDVTIDGRVTRDVVVILGNLDLRGKVGGTVTGVLSEFELKDAEISGELVGIITGLDLDNTRVSREMINILGSLDRDELSRVAGEFIDIGFGSWAPSFWTLLFWIRLFHKFVVFVLLLVLVAIVPERIRAIGEEAPVRYLSAFFVGLLGYLGMLVLGVLLSVTLIGLPLAVVGFWVFKWLGIAGIFHAVGRRIGRAAGIEMSVLGAVLLIFAVYTVSSLAPGSLGMAGLALVVTLRAMFFFLFEVPAVGLVILTRAGSRDTREPVTLPAPAQGPPPPTAPPPANPTPPTT